MKTLNTLLPLLIVSAVVSLGPVRAYGQQPAPEPTHEQTIVEGKWMQAPLNNERADFESDGLPLGEVAKILGDRAKRAFDVILPHDTGDLDVTQVAVKLRLKNVSIVEVFQAMNLQFELSGAAAPIRWQLIMNNERPTAIVKILSKLERPPQESSPKRTAVMYVGDLATTQNAPGASFSTEVKKIVGAIELASNQAGIGPITVNSYPDGELIVVTGTDEQINLVREILNALNRKAVHDRPVMVAPKPAPLPAPAPAPAPAPVPPPPAEPKAY